MVLPAFAGDISGTVTRDSDNQPIAGLLIYANEYSVGGSGGSAQTQADGSYTITGLPAGSYRVWTETYGTDYVGEYYNNTTYSSASPVAVTAGQTTSGIDFSLALGGRISGKVIKDSDSQPIAGLWVSASEYSMAAAGGYALTQADGSYTITGLATESYRVRVDRSSTDYVGEYYNNTTDYDSAAQVVVTQGQTTPDIDFAVLGWSAGAISNEYGLVQLYDAILALQVLAGVDVTGRIRPNYSTSGADISGNGRTGLQEALYILQKVAGMR